MTDRPDRLPYGHAKPPNAPRAPRGPTNYYSNLVYALELTIEQRNRAVRALADWETLIKLRLSSLLHEPLLDEPWAKEVLDD